MTRIQVKKEDNEVSKNNVSTVGVWWAPDSKGVGFKNNQELLVPKDCRVVFLVKNKNQLDSIKQFIKSELNKNKKEKLCAVTE